MYKNVKIAHELVKIAKSLIAEEKDLLTDEEINDINKYVNVPFAPVEMEFERKGEKSCVMNMGFPYPDPFAEMGLSSSKLIDDCVLIMKENGKFIVKLFWFFKKRKQVVNVAEASTIEDLAKKMDSSEVERIFGNIYDPDGLDTRW